MAPYAKTGPSWQHRIRAVVAEAIRMRRTVWGRQYAGFLRGQADVLDSYFGLSTARSIAPGRALQIRRATAIGVIVEANPHWTTADVANAVGMVPAGAHRYVKAARRKYVPKES